MAFAIRKLSVLAYANGFTLWHYRADADLLDNVVAQGFFADAADVLASGDIVMISASDGARILCVEGRATPTLGVKSSGVMLACLT
jgi:hypothetical protein